MTAAPCGRRVEIAGVHVVPSRVEDATQILIRMALHADAEPVRLVNAYSLASSQTDKSYGKLLRATYGVNFADGTPLSWLVRLGGGSARAVRGPSLFTNVLDKGRNEDLKHFLLGTTPLALAKLEQVVLSRYPGVQIVGSYGPPFGPVNDAFVNDAAEKILETNAQLVWIAIGTPKQDFAADRLAKVVGRPCVAVGAAFDFVSGEAREAPGWLHNTGMEWSYRFLCEPRRLWRRYLIGNAVFAQIAIKHIVSTCIQRKPRA